MRKHSSLPYVQLGWHGPLLHNVCIGGSERCCQPGLFLRRHRGLRTSHPNLTVESHYLYLLFSVDFFDIRSSFVHIPEYLIVLVCLFLIFRSFSEVFNYMLPVSSVAQSW